MEGTTIEEEGEITNNLDISISHDSTSSQPNRDTSSSLVNTSTIFNKTYSDGETPDRDLDFHITIKKKKKNGKGLSPVQLKFTRSKSISSFFDV